MDSGGLVWGKGTIMSVKKNMFCLPSRHKAESAGRSCVGRCHNPYASINTFFSNMKHTNAEGESPFVSRRTYRGNCGSAASGDTLWRSPERPSHCPNKRSRPLCNQACKNQTHKGPESHQSHGAPTHPSPQSAETREADKVGHKLFILLWCTNTYQVWSRRYWFHLAETSTPSRLSLLESLPAEEATPQSHHTDCSEGPASCMHISWR